MTDEISAAAAIMGRKGGREGGKSRSPAKIAAAIANGRLGGRPARWILVYPSLRARGEWVTETPRGETRNHDNRADAEAHAATRTKNVLFQRDHPQ
jgi:hypothetical protein